MTGAVAPNFFVETLCILLPPEPGFNGAPQDTQSWLLMKGSHPHAASPVLHTQKDHTLMVVPMV